MFHNSNYQDIWEKIKGLSQSHFLFPFNIESGYVVLNMLSTNNAGKEKIG